MTKNLQKTYVFLSHPISNIGGAQLYVRDKSKYLARNGFNVIVISGYTGDNIVIPEFLPFKENVFPQLKYKPFIYSKRLRKKILFSITKIIENTSDVIIETSDLNSGEWGELIAANINAKHVVFCLSEEFPPLSRWEFSFAKFKHERKELFGISRNSLPLLFGCSIADDENYFWRAVSDNMPMDVPNERIASIQKKEFNIGSIGRYDKPYVQTMLIDLSHFVKTHPNYSINLVLCIGQHKVEDEQRIFEHFMNLKNVEIHILGPLNPLPTSLFKLCDVFISTAGCAAISLNMGVPTITLDVFDSKPIGILGYTTMNAVYRENEEKHELDELLEDILIRKKYEGVPPKKIIHNNDEQYEKQLQDILCQNEIKHYTFEKVRLTPKLVIMKIMMLLGEGAYEKIRKIALKIE